jgi:hypothetical protein
MTDFRFFNHDILKISLAVIRRVHGLPQRARRDDSGSSLS